MFLLSKREKGWTYSTKNMFIFTKNFVQPYDDYIPLSVV